jgi:IclR family transcriptional regulator, KDG regulon repressor
MDDSFAKGLRVLETLAAAEQPLGLTQIAEQAGLIKSHTHKFLHTLIQQRYVEQLYARGPYRLSLKLWELGARSLARTDLISAAREPMRDITAKTGETSTIAVYESGDAVYVYKIDGTREVRTNPDVGRRRPAYCVAAGKAILAYLPPDIAEGLAPRIKRFTAQTVRNKTVLLTQLAEIRSQGYAVNWGEWTDAVRGIAAPIRNAEGHVIAALNLSVPAERLDKVAAAKLAPLVTTCAMTISRRLGFSASRFTASGELR